MKSILLAILISSVLLLSACASSEPKVLPYPGPGAPPPPAGYTYDLPSETQIDDVAVQQYASEIIAELTTLYEKFEGGEAHARQISEQGQAPYQMAIGYMAEVRTTYDRIASKPAPIGAENLKNTVLSKLGELKVGLDEIAQKEADDVSLADPHTFYVAYLEVLIELPELMQTINEY